MKPSGFIKASTFWWLAFAFACFQALMVQKLVLPLMPAMHAGNGLLVNDAILFHEQAWEIAQEIRTKGWGEWSLFPRAFTGNVALLSALYAVFGPEPAVFIPFNAAAHVTGALMLFLIGPLLWPGRTGQLGGLVAAILFVAFPSSLLWYSQNHKDAFAIAGCLAMLYLWLRIQSPNASPMVLWKILLLALLASGVVLAARPYLALLVGGGLLCSWLVCFLFDLKKSGLREGLKKQGPAAAFMVVALVAAYVGFALPAAKNALAEQLWGDEELIFYVKDGDKVRPWKWRTGTLLSPIVEAPFKRMSELRVHFIVFGRAVGAGSGIDEDRAPESAMEAVLYIPRALVIGAFAPFPTSWAERVSVPRLTAAAETFVWYLFFPGLLVLLLRQPGKTLWAGLVFGAALIVIIGYTSPNVGTLYRVRYGLWMFALLGGAVGWAGLLQPFLERISNRSGSSSAFSNPGDRANQSIGDLAAAGSVALVIMFVGYLGFLARDLLLINTQGMAAGLDAFFSAAMLPMVMVNCLAMPMGDTITKLFIATFQQGDSTSAGRIMRSFLGIGSTLMASAALLVVLLAPVAVRLVLGAADPGLLDEGTKYLRLFAPIVFLSAWTVLGNCLLNSLQLSRQAAAAQLAVPVFAIAAILVAPPGQILFAGVLGMVIGTLANAILVVFLCWRKGFILWPSFGKTTFSQPVLRPYSWLVFAAIFTAVAPPVNYAFAGGIGEGSLSSWAFANKIIVLFNGLFAFGITAVVLPHLARTFERDKNVEGRDHFYFLLVAGTWVGGLISLGISIFAEPLVFALFSSGEVTEAQIMTLAHVLRIGALQIPAAIAGAIVLKSAVVSGASSKTVAASAFGLTANILVNLWLVPRFGLEGVAFGALAFVAISTFYLAASTREKYGTSLIVPFVLLAGWVAWAWMVLAIERGGTANLFMACAGLAVLALLHWATWTKNLHHRASLK